MQAFFTRILKYFKSVINPENEMNSVGYFKKNKDEIARENLTTMKIACIVGLCMTAVLFTMAPRIIKGWELTSEYYYLIPIQVVFLVFSLICLKIKKPVPSIVVEIACALLFASLMATFIALSVFPYPNTPQIYVSICFMLMPVLLIQRVIVTVCLTIGSEAVFLYLVTAFKTPQCAEQDIFNTIATMFFAFVILGTTTRLRIRDYSARSKFRHLSMTDPLTGLLNKGEFERQCCAHLATNSDESSCVLIIIDIDNFKNINDTYGHKSGDELLKSFGAILMKMFRQSDMMGRIGGDEFAVMIRDLLPPNELERRLDRIQNALREASYNGTTFNCSCSIGVAVAEHKQSSYDELYKVADGALYEIKEKGKAGYHIDYSAKAQTETV